jgi:hypothetical protein
MIYIKSGPIITRQLMVARLNGSREELYIV